MTRSTPCTIIRDKTVFFFVNPDFIGQKEEGFLLDNEDEYMNEDDDFKFAFPTVNAPSVEFSQNSMMMSKRYDEESRIERNRRSKEYSDDRNNEIF